MRGENIFVAELVKPSVRFFLHLPCLVPRLRMANADGGCDSFRIIHHLTEDERCRSGCLITNHDREVVTNTVIGVFTVTHPVRRNVAGVTDGKAVVIRRTAKFLDNLERGGLLALKAIRIDRVHYRHRCFVRDVLHNLHARVEITLDLDNDSAMDHCLRELAQRDLSLRDDHETGNPGARGIGRGGRRSVACGSANDRAAALLDRLAPEVTHIAARAAEIVRDHLGDGGQVFLFGSWADGTARERSDIDIGVLAAGPVDGAVIEAMRESIEELPTLYTVDLVDLATVSADFRARALANAREIG